MRRAAVAIAALLLASTATPVLASGGQTKLANVEAGPYLAALYNDSPDLATGSNVLTVKVPSLSPEHVLRLDLIGPNREQIAVPLRPVIVLDEVDDGEHSHADGQADPHAAPVAVTTVASHDAHGPADDHGATATHSPAPADAHGGHGSTAPATHEPPESVQARSETYLARGTVSLPSAGAWTVRLVVLDPHGVETAGETPVKAIQGGPSRLYLGFTGTLIFGSMLFGMIQRRRQPARAAVAR